MSKRRFEHIVIAGTFDHLHTGHTYFLDQAFHLGDKVAVCITSDSFVTQKKFSQVIEPSSKRLAHIKKYLATKNYLARASFFSIDNMYGPAIVDPKLQAILATSQTYQNARRVNDVRQKNGLPRLTIIKLHLKKAGDNKPISSTRIRRGEIDREGHIYRYIYKKTTSLKLPAHLRGQLRQPAGKVIRGGESNLEIVSQKIKQFIEREQPIMVIAVGDVIAYSLSKVGYVPDLTIIDFKTQRRQVKNWQKLSPTSSHLNPHGTVSKTASEAIRQAVKDISERKQKKVLRILGEEDLLTTTAILNAPLGAYVLYGQRNLGGVIVKVTEEKKDYIAQLLKRFSS